MKVCSFWQAPFHCLSAQFTKEAQHLPLVAAQEETLAREAALEILGTPEQAVAPALVEALELKQRMMMVCVYSSSLHTFFLAENAVNSTNTAPGANQDPILGGICAPAIPVAHHFFRFSRGRQLWRMPEWRKMRPRWVLRLLRNWIRGIPLRNTYVKLVKAAVHLQLLPVQCNSVLGDYPDMKVLDGGMAPTCTLGDAAKPLEPFECKKVVDACNVLASCASLCCS